MELKNNVKGITLIALVVTIIALLILAGVAINLTIGQNGIFTKAQEAAIVTAVASVKEEIELERGGKLIGNEKLSPEDMVSEGKANRMVRENEDGAYQMYYALKEGSYKGMQNFGKGEISSFKDVFLIDDNLHVKYISSDGKEYGDELEEKVLNDDTKISFSSKSFSEYISNLAGVKEEDLKFEWLKNQTSITISDSSIDNLRDLSFFPNLTELSLSGITLENLEGIENCSKLSYLNIVRSNIGDYSNLKNTNIDKIRFYGMNIENSLDSLAGMRNLKNLMIYYNSDLNNLNKLKNLKNLESLYILDSPLENIQGIENLNKLTSLSIISSENIKDFSPIYSLPNLTSLEIRSCGLENVDGINNLTNLTILTLTNNNISNILPISSLDNLVTLTLTGNPNIEANRENYTEEELEKIDKIGSILNKTNGQININTNQLKLFGTSYKRLTLNAQNLETLEDLEGLTNLEYLNLDSNNITLTDKKSQEIIKSMTKLKTLILSKNPVEDISAINSLQNLKSLDINYGSYNVDLSQIEDIISNITLTTSSETAKTITNCDVNKITKLNIGMRNTTKFK